MNNYQRFRDYAEAKEMAQQPTVDAKAERLSAKPNQDLPNPPKLPQLLNLKAKDKPLGGYDYKGQLRTDAEQPIEDAIPYKADKHGDATSGPGIGKGEVLVAQYKDNKPKSGLGFDSNKIQTTSNSTALGKDPDLKYKDVHGPHKMTSEQFVEQTKDMSPAEFISFFVEGSDEPLPTVTDLYGNEFTPDPTQTIQYLASLMVKNPRLMTRLVREIKRHEGGFGGLMNESQSHPEFYHTMVQGMVEPEEGKKRCGRLARAMNDQYMDELNKITIEHNLNEEVSIRHDMPENLGGDPIGGAKQPPSSTAPPKTLKPQLGGPMSFGTQNIPGQTPVSPMGGGGVTNEPAPPATGGGIGPPSAGGPDMMGGGFDAGGGPDAGMPGATPGAMPPGATPPLMPPGSGAGPAAGIPGPPNMGGLGGPQMPSAPGKKFMGETAHGNLIESMGSHPDIYGHMADYCINCHKNKEN